MMNAGMAVLLPGLLMLVGALFHLYRVWRFHRCYPAPGKYADVNGFRAHYLVEGDRASRPTVVWIPGSHDPGIEMLDLHNALSGWNRSFIFDRFGSGWSDTGSGPRSLSNEAAELSAILEQAGETAPVILAGHSLGGMLATSFARMYPEKVAGLLLLDAGTADNFAYVSGLRGPGNIPGDSLWLSVMAAFGLLWMRLPAKDPGKYDRSELGQMRLGLMAQPKSHTGWVYALNAIFDDPLGLVREAGSLGNVPLYALVPDGQGMSDRHRLKQALPDFSDLQIANLAALQEQRGEVNAALSTQGRIKVGPPGTTHDLHREEPGFILDELRHLLEQVTGETDG
ncbi:alpha/beta fold hydrolase [Emcibacter nanhaiensis]